MLTREIQSPCHWVLLSHLWVSSHCFCVATGVGQSFHVSLPGLSTCCVSSESGTGPHVSPKVYTFSKWSETLTILSARRNEKGNTMDRPQCTWLVLISVLTLLSWLAPISRKHICIWKVSYCLRGFAQKCHSGFSSSPKTTSISYHQCSESLGN